MEALPVGTFCPFSIEEYANKLQYLYHINEKEKVLEETYACCVYLPPRIRNETKSIYIASKRFAGIDAIE